MMHTFDDLVTIQGKQNLIFTSHRHELSRLISLTTFREYSQIENIQSSPHVLHPNLGKRAFKMQTSGEQISAEF